MGILRSTRDEDLTQLSESATRDCKHLLDDVFRRSRGVTDQHIFTDFPLVFAPANHRNCRIMVEDGMVVSHAALWERELVVDDARLKVGEIVVVATHPDYRLRGYAASLMRGLQATMHDENYDMGILWTGVPDFYRKQDWEVVTPRGWVVEMDGVQLPRGEDVISRYDEVWHLDGIIALHEQEPVRFSRSQDEAVALLALPKIDVWVTTHNGEIVAYLVRGEAVNKRGIIEYSGEVNSILALIAHVLKQQPSTANTRLLAYHIRPDLIARLRALGARMRPLAGSKGDGSEMIYVVNPSRVTPHVREQLFVWGLDHA
jgi:GNAT superfamily N-acetyltransferase